MQKILNEISDRGFAAARKRELCNNNAQTSCLRPTYMASVRPDGAGGGIHDGGAVVVEVLRALGAPEVVRE
eukprot:11634993-Alexandrium_andersonii.AAC.1